MCGINGFIVAKESSFNPNERIESMNRTLSHRGPDDTGVGFFDISENFVWAFWQARLSIIDLSLRGHQPMYYTHGFGASNDRFEKQENWEYSIIFNGEIYNYADIRQELESLGYTFSTQSDTEVILASYHAWGQDAVHKWNGMWAICLFDKIKNQVFCSRDRLGKKPFYYFQDATHFIFSSEIKGILEHTELGINTAQNIDSEAIDFYFTTGYIPAPRTIYKTIKKLQAGENMILSFEANQIVLNHSRYYEIPSFVPEYNRDVLVEDWKNLLADAVKIRMFSADVPVGAFLSGGLDSSSVVAEMTKHTDKSKLHTFSIGFEGRYDETPYINIVKDAFGTNHHHEYFTEEKFRELIDIIPYHYDEPFGDYSNFPTTFVSALARKYVTVSLSGDGWDEIFWGYMMHKVARQMEYLYRLPTFLKKILHTIIPATSNNLSLLSKLKEALRVATFPKEDFYAELWGSTLYRPESYKIWTREKLKYLLEKNNGDFVQTIIDFDLLYNTIPDNFLVKVDRASMSQSLEVRSPFLDYRFVEFARRIPTKWKVSTSRTKILMRDIIRGIVPDTIVNRGKQGFEPPIDKWIISYMGEIVSWLESLYERHIISEEWYHFYKHTVLKENNQVFNVFKIKLFLLIKWKDRWIQE